ncbi:hypothetical protein D0T57_01355 [Dysgonomonas sp. 511]|nr:hypothetical protein [Dysgonomonas sp. 511]
MKANKKILFLFLILGLFALPFVSAEAEETSPPSTEVGSSQLPSVKYLQEAKRSMATTTTTSSSASSARAIAPHSISTWAGPPGGGTGGGTEVGGGEGDPTPPEPGPIGDVSIPILFSILLLYLFYRRTTTSRNRSL